MQTAEITIFGLISFLFLIVGILIGWVVREYMMNYREIPKLHPEFYDSNGNIIPDEVLAVSFNPDYFDFDDDQNEDED
jgi:hypothetical protein